MLFDRLGALDAKELAEVLNTELATEDKGENKIMATKEQVARYRYNKKISKLWTVQDKAKGMLVAHH